LAGRTAVEEALKRRGVKARVSSYPLCTTIYQMGFEPVRFPRVSIVIPTRNAMGLLRKCVESIRSHTSYPNYEILVIDNMSDDSDIIEYLEKETSLNRLKVVRYDRPFNHSEMNNLVVAGINSEFVVLMNNDIEVLSEKWLEQLLGVTELDKKIAMVGCMLLYPMGLVQHGGIVLGLLGAAGHAHKGARPDEPGYLGRLQTLQEFSGVTAAMALIRRDSFLAVGGFNAERYPNVYNDVDLCIRLRKAGNRCIYNPMVRAIHHESKTRPITAEALRSRNRIIADYGPILFNDPFYNPNLSLNSELFAGYREFPVEEQIPQLRESEVVTTG
jgi:GT2 family glycosyltransferase